MEYHTLVLVDHGLPSTSVISRTETLCYSPKCKGLLWDLCGLCLWNSLHLENPCWKTDPRALCKCCLWKTQKQNFPSWFCVAAQAQMTLMYLCQAVSFLNYCSLPLAGVAQSFCFMVLSLPYPSWPCPHFGNLIRWFDAPDWEKRCLVKDAPVEAKFTV